MSKVSAAGSQPGGNRDTASHEPSDQKTEALLNRLAKPPRVWIGLMLSAALLAALDISRNAAGKYATDFHVGPESLIALGLIWLPLLLKVFALAGGSFKAVGVEATVVGVFTQAEAIDLSVKARQVTSAGDEGERKLAAQDLEESVNRFVLPGNEDATISDALLVQLARDYERLRRDLDAGSRRTSAMTRIVNEARARASLAPESAGRTAVALLKSRRQGDRIVGLGLTQETGDPAGFETVLEMVSGSASAFEMYHALLALQEMSFGLSEAQKGQALKSLQRERRDPRSVGINTDPGLSSLLARTEGILTGIE